MAVDIVLSGCRLALVESSDEVQGAGNLTMAHDSTLGLFGGSEQGGIGWSQACSSALCPIASKTCLQPALVSRILVACEGYNWDAYFFYRTHNLVLGAA